MKVDGLGIILIAIILPIILIVTFYIQLEVDTIAKENEYNTKLLSATYDAVSAFEINTANEDLSTVADSMRSIILASNNVFFNTLATNFGMSNASKELLQPYIPAILYTMYDGYYIYAPSEIPIIAEETKEDSGLITSGEYYSVGNLEETGIDSTSVDGYDKKNYGDIIYMADTTKTGGKTYTTNIEKAQMKTDYVLKPYMQYVARYESGNIDVTINYTLDNYLNIEGVINDVYYTKTGYLIKDKLVSDIYIDGNIENTNYSLYNEDDIKNKVLGKKTNSDDTTIKVAENASLKVNGLEISVKWTENLSRIDGVSTISEVETLIENGKITDNDIIYDVQKYKAIAYYASSAVFSNWVYSKLGSLTYDSIKDDIIQSTFKNYESVLADGDKSNFYHSFNENGNLIFESSQDPEDKTSNFYTHKLEVIKNSIKYNLNLVISNYSNKMNTSYNFSLPVLTDSEWDKILGNISVVSFMQGWDCGLDIYNNYEICSSTNNEVMVTPNEIYYVKKSEFNNKSGFYHRINCNQLDNDDYISFTSKEVKYDKIYDSSTGLYKYDHKNLACYECINTNNYTAPADDALAGTKKIGKLIGIATQRQSIYKTNALPKSEGYKVKECNKIFNYPPDDPDGFEVNFEINIDVELSNLKEIQITIEDVILRLDNGTIPAVGIVNIAGKEYNIVNQEREQTICVDVRDNNLGSTIEFINSVDRYKKFYYKIKSIKLIYN